MKKYPKLNVVFWLASFWMPRNVALWPSDMAKKRDLVLAEDCAGLGSLRESCRLLGLLYIHVYGMPD